MGYRTRIAIFGCLLLAGSNLYGLTLNWDDIVALAKKNNQQLIKSELSLKQADIEYSKALTNFYPQLNSSGGYSKSGIVDGSSSDNFSLGITGNITVFSGFYDVLGLLIQKTNKKIEQQNYIRTYSDVIYGLKTCYINLLASQEMLALWQDIQKKRTDNYNLVRIKYQAGREDKGSLLRMEADKLQADYETANAKRDINSAVLELLKNIGISLADSIQVIGKLSADSLLYTVESDSLILNVPEYCLAKYQIDKSKLVLRQSQSGYYPDISLSSGLSQNGSALPLDKTNWNVGVTLSYPLTSNLIRKYEVNTDRNSMRINVKTFEATVLALNTIIKTSQNELLRAIENIAIGEKYLEASSEQSRITSVRYRNGLATYSEWYTVEADYVNAQKNLLAYRKNAILLQAKYKNILGEGE